MGNSKFCPKGAYRNREGGRIMFQRRHIIIIADILKEQRACYQIINRWADMLGHYNHRFDRDRFFQACGWEE